MEYSKTTIRKLIGEGELNTATTAALGYAEQCGLPDIANALTGIGSRMQDLQAKWNSGQISYSDFSIAHAKILNDLVEWVSHLPESPKPAGSRRKFMTETVFKKRIFYLLLLIKALVLLRLCYHWSTGGFNDDQFQGTATLLAPALAAYIAVVVADYLRQQNQAPQPPRYISGPLVAFSYWLFPAYAVFLLLFIELKAKSSVSFTAMNTGLALVESVLGGYVGQLVHGFFKKED